MDAPSVRILTRRPENMDNVWFRKSKNGMYWMPVAWQGWLLKGVWFLSNIWYFRQINSVSHSLSDTLLNFALYFIVSTLALVLIIRNRCGRKWH